MRRWRTPSCPAHSSTADCAMMSSWLCGWPGTRASSSCAPAKSIQAPSLQRVQPGRSSGVAPRHSSPATGRLGAPESQHVCMYTLLGPVCWRKQLAVTFSPPSELACAFFMSWKEREAPLGPISISPWGVTGTVYEQGAGVRGNGKRSRQSSPNFARASQRQKAAPGSATHDLLGTPRLVPARLL